MSKSLIQILIITLITIVAIVGFEAYHKAKESVLPSIVEEQLTPLNPSLKTDLLEKLKRTQEQSPAKEVINLPF